MMSTLSGRNWSAHILLLALVGVSACETSRNPFLPAEFVPFEWTDPVIGTGPEAADGDVLTVESTIWLYEEDPPEHKGEQVEMSESTFVLGARQAIVGLEEGLPGMRVGGLRRLIVPASLAFGRTGSSTVPPNRNLIIEVLLLELEPLATDSAPFSSTDLRVGTGVEVADGDSITVSFGGWLYKENEPDNKGFLFDSGGGFRVVVGSGQVIEGWDLGLPGMRDGGERRLIIPPELAYGSAGRLPLIPPDATLVFDITVTSVP